MPCCSGVPRRSIAIGATEPARVRWTISPAAGLRGRIRLPGDKSISHRALLLAAVADGRSRLRGLADGADVASTRSVLQSLGVQIDIESSAASEPMPEVVIHGKGLGSLRPPAAPLDCGNSGTTLRLLAGLLAGAGVEATLTGDVSLRRRPMQRPRRPGLSCTLL